MRSEKNRMFILAVGIVLLSLIFLGIPSGEVSAEGDETLGPANITVEDGSDIIAAGIGLLGTTSGNLTVDVPAGATVQQVLLYWSGEMVTGNPGDDLITVDGNPRIGTLVGTSILTSDTATTYRDDITDLGLVGPGTNTLAIGDLNYATNYGAGVMVIIDDGSGTAEIDIRDGHDHAYINNPNPDLKVTVLQTYNFTPSTSDREATLVMFFGDVIPGRPNEIEVYVGGVLTLLVDPLASKDGEFWDSITESVTIPAGVSQVTVQAFSRATQGQTLIPASMAWNIATLSVPPPPSCSIGDYVWVDANRDGCQDDTETGLNGVTVEIYEDCTLTTLRDSTVTANDAAGVSGYYEFDNLECGREYGIVFVDPGADLETTVVNSCLSDPNDPGSNDDTKDSDCIDEQLVCATAGDENATPGTINPTIDCGYVPPPDPRIDIEKLTNGNQADGANDGDVPQIAPGATVIWTYLVTNTGNVAFEKANVAVTDDQSAFTNVTPEFVPGGGTDDGDDFLAPGEVWEYTAEVPAENLATSTSGVTIVPGCDPGQTGITRETYENVGTVTESEFTLEDTDPSHYCNPPDPGIDIEKLTNGNQADGANDADVPQIAPGATVTWTYVVTNTGNIAFAKADVIVTDDQFSNNGVTPVFVPGGGTDDGDDILAPGEVWEYTANLPAENLATSTSGVTIVPGCDPDNTGFERGTYENVGTVVAGSLTDFDPSHYCNPPDPAIDIEKLTNGNQADGANDGDVPQIAPGATVTWTYVVTNTGNVAFAKANVAVTDDQFPNNGVTPVFVPGGGTDDGDDFLAPGEVWEYTANLPAENLATSTSGVTIVPGCDPGQTGIMRETYENVGTVTESEFTLEDTDPSHYCNPPDPGIDIEKLTNGNQADGANDADVPQIPPGDTVTWTYVVTNTGNIAFAKADVIVTDDQFPNNGVTPEFVPGGGTDDGDDFLAPGEVWEYTANLPAENLATSTSGVTIVEGCDPGQTGITRDTYENVGTVMAGNLTDFDPSHYCNPPECGLTVEKSCETPAPPSADGKCDGKLQQFTMIWDGADGTPISGVSNNSGGTVDNGDEVIFSGPFSNNDVVVTVGSGQSTFHVSCSDRDMDGDTTTNEDQQQVSPFGRDCGKDQGNGKGSSGINEWLLEGFIDKNNAVLDCTSESGPGAAECEFTPVEASCDTLGKPSNLTFVYTGGGCPGDNDQGSKSDCSGSINSSLPVTVTLDGGTLGEVDPGETFIVPTTGSNTTIMLSNDGGTETNDVHTSCSAPLAAGDSYGSMTLVALDGQGLGTNILYSYLVSNQGSVDVTDITVDDDQLGNIGTIDVLEPGDSETLTATAFISATTTNIATVDGDGAPGAECTSDSNAVTVTVLSPPPCDVSIAFKELKDDAIKWTLSNGNQGKATMDTFTLDFPAAFGAIKEVKLDGGIFKSGDSDTYPNGVLPGETIGPDDWTQTDVSKRQLDPGESRTLEVKFTQKDKNASQGDFDLTVTFEEGCVVSF